MGEISLETVSLNIIVHDVINLSQIDGKICQIIKPPTPTHIPFSVQLSTWERLED